jgi:hypothetical protein
MAYLAVVRSMPHLNSIPSSTSNSRIFQSKHRYRPFAVMLRCVYIDSYSEDFNV